MKRMILAVLFTQVFALSVQAQFTDLPSSGGFSAGDNGGGGGGGGRRRARPAAEAAPVERPAIVVTESVTSMKESIGKIISYNNTMCNVIDRVARAYNADRRSHPNSQRDWAHQPADYIVIDDNNSTEEERRALGVGSNARRVIGAYRDLGALGSLCRNWAARRGTISSELSVVDAIIGRAAGYGSEFNFTCEALPANPTPSVRMGHDACIEMRVGLLSSINKIDTQFDSIEALPHSGLFFDPNARSEGVTELRNVQRAFRAFLR